MTSLITRNKASRRQVLKGAVALAGASVVGAPAIVRAQAKGKIVIGTWGGDYARLLTKNIEQPLLIVARKDFPPGNLREFVSYVKANADRLNMGHAGVGSNVYNFGLLLNAVLGVKPTLIPFSGSGPGANALLAGQVDYMLNAVPEVGQLVQAGRIKAYAAGSPRRSPILPEVPTAEVVVGDVLALTRGQNWRRT